MNWAISRFNILCNTYINFFLLLIAYKMYFNVFCYCCCWCLHFMCKVTIFVFCYFNLFAFIITLITGKKRIEIVWVCIWSLCLCISEFVVSWWWCSIFPSKSINDFFWVNNFMQCSCTHINRTFKHRFDNFLSSAY